jgi:methylmalonyl-CoA/ethylmalonyl-CoA epimerase
MIRRVDHLGIAVRNLDESLRFWTLALGLELEGREVVPTEGVEVAFLPAGSTRIELLESRSPDSAVARFLDKRGPGIHHVTFEVDDISATLERLGSLGMGLLDRAPRPGAGGSRVAFLHPRTTGGVLVELVERPGRAAPRGFLEPGETVLAYLHDPHEKIWGVLRRLDASGVVLEGIDLASFDDWAAQIERGEDRAVGPSVIFVPTPRIEKILLDRPSGALPSLADRFRSRTGRTVQEALGGEDSGYD